MIGHTTETSKFTICSLLLTVHASRFEKKILRTAQSIANLSASFFFKHEACYSTYG